MRSAFTLIELLVVIAIVALLAAILFPVFAQVREKGRQTTCLSNEKQLSLGVLIYAQDSDEILPPVQRLNEVGEEVLLPQIIQPYVKNDKVRLCPSDVKATNCSYGLNEMGFVDLTDTPPPPPVALADFRAPAGTVMMGELGTNDDFKTDRPDAFTLPAPDGPGDPPTPNILTDPADARPAPRHFGGTNVGFMDGHCKVMKLNQFYIGQTPADKWFCRNPDNCVSD